MTKTSNNLAEVELRAPRSRPGAGRRVPSRDLALERALEGLFRLGANRRFDARQAAAVGAVVTRAGYAMLRSLADADALDATLSLRQAADACAMDAATASRQLVALVEEGLVERRTGDDARAISLRLTDRGREVYERIVRYRLSYLTGALKEWPAKDRAALTSLVQRLAADLTTQPFPSADN
jgi:DNA-binding MarR family transcriptional regulator